MAAIGTGQVIQHSGAVERIQESLQQQMDLRQKALQGRREKDDVRKRTAVQSSPSADQITIHADREKGRNGRRDGDADDDESPRPETGEGEDVEKTAPPSGHVNITI
jgi:hypothetical protein